MTDQQIRLHFGELNASEMRLARAVVGWHERQIEELKRWKAEAQAVEAEWNPQEMAKMLGASLGQSCRQIIQKRVPEILDEQAKLRAAADAMATAINSILCPGYPRGCNKPTEFEDRMLRSALAAYQATKS